MIHVISKILGSEGGRKSGHHLEQTLHIAWEFSTQMATGWVTQTAELVGLYCSVFYVGLIFGL